MALLAVRSFLLFNLASFAAAHTAESCEEPVSLLQNDLKSVQRRIAVKHHGEDSCQCLNWKQTYDSGAVLCGEGLELTSSVFAAEGGPKLTAAQWIAMMHSPTKSLPFKDWNEEICVHLLNNYDDNKCIRGGGYMDSEFFGQAWCYVSRQCGGQSLAVNGTQAPANAPQVSAKFCENGTDPFLGAMAPPELFEYGKRMGLEVPDDLVRLAYPIDGEWFWKDRAQQEWKMDELMAQGVPTVMDESGELIKDKVIVFGEKVYKMRSHGKFQTSYGIERANNYTWDLELVDREAMGSVAEWKMHKLGEVASRIGIFH